MVGDADNGDSPVGDQARRARARRILDLPVRDLTIAEMAADEAEPGPFDHVRITADIIVVAKKQTQAGAAWAMIRVVDPTGEIDVLVFPRCFAATGEVVVGDRIVVECLAVAGEGRVELGAQTIEVISRNDHDGDR